MINGISLQRFGWCEHIAFHVEPGFHCAYVPQGENALWLYVSFNDDVAAGMMAEIEKAVRLQDLEGFTLFLTNKGWQMSTRRKNESGWSMTIIPEEDARYFLSVLRPINHPDSPLEIFRPGLPASDDPAAVLTAAMRAAEGACRELAASIRARLPG